MSFRSRPDRALLVTSLLVLAMLVIVACGGGGAATTAPAPPQKPADTAAQKPAEQPKAAAPAAPAAGQVELRVAWWGSQDRHDRTIKAIDLFQKKYPNVKVTYEFSAFNDYWVKMGTQAAGNSLPDVMQHDYAYIDEWTRRGLIVPLDDYVKDKTIDFTDVAEDYVKGGRVDGKLVGINLGSNTPSIVIDVDAFKKAGVAVPADTWTWEDYEKTAMELKTKLGIWGSGTSMEDNQVWKMLYFSLGQWAYSDDGKKLGYTDDKPFIDHLNMLLRLQKAGAMPARAEMTSTYIGKPVENIPIVAGKTAMDFLHSNQIIAVWKAAGENRTLKMVAIPRMKGGKTANYIKPSQFFSITSQAKHPKEAAQFIDFITNDLPANEALLAERGVPISSKIREGLKPKLGKSQIEMFEYLDRVLKDVQPIKPADPPGHPDIVKNVYDPQIDAVMYEKTAPDKAAAILRDEATAILAKPR